MIEIDIQISISERSSAWAINYKHSSFRKFHHFIAVQVVLIMVKTLQNESSAVQTTREMHELVRNNVVTEEESS